MRFKRTSVIVLFVAISAANCFALQTSAAPLENAQNSTNKLTVSESEESEEAELVKKTLNPIASLISLPIQNNWDFGIGPANAMKYTANVQPVVPVSLNDDWNLIIRTIAPIIYAEALTENPLASPSARDSHSGLGDITQSFFVSPKKEVGGWIMGGGPVFLYPSATESALGAGKWGIGPTAVLLQQRKGWTYGILANQIWSFAGQESRETVSAAFLQPFVGYSTKTFTTFMVNTETTYNWEASSGNEATVPVNFMLTQLLKIGKQPISLQLGYRYYADAPEGGPDWGLRFAVTFLFPTSH